MHPPWHDGGMMKGKKNRPKTWDDGMMVSKRPANNAETNFFLKKKWVFLWWVDGGMMVYGRGGKAIFRGLMDDG